jgi:hypothetical protein
MAKNAIVTAIQRMSCMLSLQLEIVLEIVAGQLVHRGRELSLPFLRRKQYLAFDARVSHQEEAQLKTKS